MGINWDAIDGGKEAPAPVTPSGRINWDAISTVEKQPPAPAHAAEPPQSWWERQRNGLASAPINAYLGIKQMFGGLDPLEQDILRQNQEAAAKAPGAAVLSNVGMLAPTMFIPGANGVVGAGVVGALNGLAQPVAGEQTASNIIAGKAKNAALGGVVGSGGAAVMGSAANAAANNLTNAQAQAATQASLNSVRDATLAAGRQAGYVVPNSAVAPSFWNNRLESLGGKAAIKQQATIQNQQATNALARRALGVSDDTPISDNLLESLRQQHSGPYAEVAALPPRPAVTGSTVTNTPADPGFNPAQALQDLRQARNDAQGWFRSYERSANPTEQAQAQAAQARADGLEQALQDHATAMGRPDLVPALVKARREIAKTYTVERALNSATGDVSAAKLGRDFNSGEPLSDGLDTIGQVATAFPQFTGNAPSTPAPGVSKSEALASALLAMGGHAAAGPWGLLAGAAPMASHAARALALSGAAQATPTYEASLLARALAAPSAEGLTAVTQGLSSYGIPLLTAQ